MIINSINIRGNMKTEFSHSHIHLDKKYYKANINVKRNSDTYDLIEIIVPEELIDPKKSYIGKNVSVKGSIRNKITNSHYRVFVLVSELEIHEEEKFDNEFHMVGRPCNKGSYRKTPRGRTINNRLFAINRSYGKTDYLPLISWGKTADKTKDINIGDDVDIKGRLQSRLYLKDDEVHMVHEISVDKLGVACGI